MGDHNGIRFPLLRLPKKAQQRTIQVMLPLHSLGLSTISKTAKAIVKSSKLKCVSVDLIFDQVGSFCMEFYYPDTNRSHDIYMSFPLENINAEGDLFQETPELRWNWMGDSFFNLWSKPNRSIGCWIDHFLTVLNYKFIDGTAVTAERVNINSIRHIFIQHKTYKFLLNCGPTPDYAVDVLKTIVPMERYGYWRTIPHHAFAKVNIQNLSCLETSEDDSLTFDDLLMNNSAHLTAYSNLNPKQINRFVKLWMKNSNPRLKSLLLLRRAERVSGAADCKKKEEVLLEGIHYESKTYEPARKVPVVRTANNIRELWRGFEIRRKDGVKATIVFNVGFHHDRFEMFVSQ